MVAREETYVTILYFIIERSQTQESNYRNVGESQRVIVDFRTQRRRWQRKGYLQNDKGAKIRGKKTRVENFYGPRKNRVVKTFCWNGLEDFLLPRFRPRRARTRKNIRPHASAVARRVYSYKRSRSVPGSRYRERTPPGVCGGHHGDDVRIKRCAVSRYNGRVWGFFLFFFANKHENAAGTFL